MNEETLRPVLQAFPEEYQPLLATIAGIVMAIIGLVALLWPFISKWSTNKQVAAINNSALSSEDIQSAVDKALVQYEQKRLQSDLATWKYKLIFATEETRPLIESKITEIENDLKKYV
jgi:hypothetical protein